MNVGVIYLLFVYENNGELSVDNCGNSGPITSAANKVATVKSLVR